MALSAKVNLPLPYVPMTLQTLVVLMIGAAYGWRLGSATMIAYLAEGAMGLPVFAGPVGGIAPLSARLPAISYGFVLAAFITGWLAERGWDRSWRCCSWRWRSAISSFSSPASPGWPTASALAQKAWLVGVAPFIAASVVKNALGAALMPAARRIVDRRG